MTHLSMHTVKCQLRIHNNRFIAIFFLSVCLFYVLDWWMQMDRQDNHVKKKERYIFKGEAQSNTLRTTISTCALRMVPSRNFMISTRRHLIYRQKRKREREGPAIYTHVPTIDECLFPPNGCTSKTHPITIRNQNRVHTHTHTGITSSTCTHTHTQTKAQRRRRTFFFSFSIFCQRLLFLSFF